MKVSYIEGIALQIKEGIGEIKCTSLIDEERDYSNCLKTDDPERFRVDRIIDCEGTNLIASDLIEFVQKQVSEAKQTQD